MKLSNKKSIQDVDLKGKIVLMRVDFNVPLKDGVVRDDSRVSEACPTIKFALDKGAKAVVLMSHLGRPDGCKKPEYSLKYVKASVEKHTGQSVTFVEDCVGPEVEKVCRNPPTPIILLENLRFHVEEEGKGVDADGKKMKATDDQVKAFRSNLSKLGDVFINDAFGTAHRPHSSMVGVDLPVKAAGLLMQKELVAFAKAIENPARPLVVILGGAKVADKIPCIDNLLPLSDKMIIGGGMAYTFKKHVEHISIGKSLYDAASEPKVEQYMKDGKDKIVLPSDYKISDKFEDGGEVKVVTDKEGIPDEWMGLDIGPESSKAMAAVLKDAKTIIWNGPMGVFEKPIFAEGTKAVMDAVAEATKNGAVSIIGGGDTASYVILQNRCAEVTHVSTGGGASLELLSGLELPGLAYLDEKN